MVHIQPASGIKGAEVKCDYLENVVLKDDKIFYIHECQDSRDQAEVLLRLEACLSPEPIKYTYDANFAAQKYLMPTFWK